MFTQKDSPQKLYEQSSGQKAPLGAMLVTRDGRVWRYAKAGAVDIPVGTVCQAPEQTANTWGRTSSVSGGAANPGSGGVVGTNWFRVVTGSTQAASEFDDGYVAHVLSSGGAGFCMQVSTNSAYDSTSVAGTDVFTIDDFPVTIAAGTTRSGLLENPYAGVVITEAPPGKQVVGVPQMDITAGRYFWILQRGVGFVRRDGALTEGLPVMPSDGTAGTVEAWTATVAVTGDPETATITFGNMPIGTCAAYSSTFTAGAMVNLSIL